MGLERPKIRIVDEVFINEIIKTKIICQYSQKNKKINIILLIY